MRKLIPTVFAALLVTPVIGGSAYAAFGMHGSGPGGSPSAGSNNTRSGGGPASGGGGGPIGRPGGGGGGGGPGIFRGGPGGRDRDRDRDFRGRFRGGVVFVDPWYDPFWPYGYGFGWGYGWYGPPYYTERRVTQYLEPPVDYGPPPEQYWYYCSDPDGYYPYVQSCNREWQPVPVTPPPGPRGPQSGPSASSSQSEDQPGGGG